MTVILSSQLEPGYAVAWYEDGERNPYRVVPVNGQAAHTRVRYEAERKVKQGYPTRVFAVVEIFSCAGGQMRRLPDNMQPVIDRLLADQAEGRGLVQARRGPPTEAPAEVVRALADEPPATPPPPEPAPEQLRIRTDDPTPPDRTNPITGRSRLTW